MEIEKPSVAGRFEPSLRMTYLARCPQCGHKHPQAYMPPLAFSTCPECGLDRSDVPPPTTVSAVITDGFVRFGNVLIRIGSWLSRFTNRK